MIIYFITGNKGKLAEAQAIIPSIEQLDIDLPELQDIDATAIIKAKLAEAFNQHGGPLMVEDTSVYFDALNGMPGPLIKWFSKTLGNDGLYNLAEKLGNNKAQAKVLIGFATDKDNVQFFEGVIEGEIVSPKGEGFGWDPIFKPNGYDKTFGEMNAEEKNAISMRRLALDKLKAVL